MHFFTIFLTVYFQDASMGFLGTFRGRIRVVNKYDNVIINKLCLYAKKQLYIVITRFILSLFLIHGKPIAHCAQQNDTILQIRSHSDSFNKKLLYLCKMPAFKTHHLYGVDHIRVGNCNHQLTITNYVYMQNISFLNSKTKK